MVFEKIEIFLLKPLVTEKLFFSTGNNIFTDHSSGQLRIFAFDVNLVYNVVLFPH